MTTLPKELKLRMFKTYKQKYKGKHNIQTYLNNLNLFFEITEDSIVEGDLSRPEKFGGGRWESWNHAFHFWAEKCNLSRHQMRIYYFSVNDVTSYS
tara:strand:+ start:214 stop:501 length:288 start_codon:yes stop_codon:yes gene_type:complete